MTAQRSLNLDESSLNKIVDMAMTLYPNRSREEIESVIDAHVDFQTLEVIYDGKFPVGVCRYNISPNGEIVDVLDVVVKPGYNGFKILKLLILCGWQKRPGVRYLRFERGLKYPYRKHRIYKIGKFFHIRKERRR
jgi:hypothetical protein